MIRSQFAAGIEAEPTHPQHGGAKYSVGQIMWSHVFAAKSFAASQYQSAHESGDTGTDVHDGTAGEIERTTANGHLSEPNRKIPPSPHTQWHSGQYTRVPQRIVNTTIELNFHSFGKRTADKSCSLCATAGPAVRSIPPSIRSTKLRDYEPWRRELLEQGVIEERDAGWMTGYFMLVDRDQVGDIGPDMNLPILAPRLTRVTAWRFGRAGIGSASCPTCATTRKKRSGRNKEVIHKVERYLLAKWGMFYWDCVQYTGCVLQWPGAANWRREQPECLR